MISAQSGEVILCDRCGSANVQGHGRRKGLQRYHCMACGRVSTDGQAAGARVVTEMTTAVPEGDVFVITWAQNATPVDPTTWALLHRYCEHTGAALMVIPGRYRNPTSQWTDANRGHEYWADEVMPYITAGRLDIGPHCTAYGDIMVQPTAVTPLSGFERFAGEASAIFGHPKVQLSTIASTDRMPRILATTGACTVPNYTHSKSGKKGEVHHTLGAIVVERSACGRFHLRHLTVAEDCIYDLTLRVGLDDVCDGYAPAAMVLGDLHVAKLEDEHRESTELLLRELCPERLVLHDVLDFEARNHHDTRDIFRNIRKAYGRGLLDSVENECRDAAMYLTHLATLAASTYVVDSNHDRAFDRWLVEADPRKDPKNARFWAQMFAAKALASERGEEHNAFAGYCETHHRITRIGVTFLKSEDRLTVLGYELSAHGDRGINGSRGTLLGYSKLGSRYIIGHSHTPGIRDGCMQVGVTARLDHGYNPRPSSWLNTHALIYANGTATLIHVISGQYRSS